MRKYLLATALAVMGETVYASEYVPCGSETNCWPCGDTCSARLNGEGTLIMSGTGDMYDYNVTGNKPTPWPRGRIQKVIIENGITSIGAQAFKQSSIQSVIIPNTVTTIRHAAFSRADNLNDVVIPDSVSAIEGYAFDWTISLEKLVMPDSVISIAGNTFDGSSVKNVFCSGGGDMSKCDALLKRTQAKNIQSTSRPNYKLDENGNIVERYQYDEEGNRTGYTSDGRVNKYDTEGHLVSSTKSNADGSTSFYNKDGELVGIKGKKIYTVEEAEAVTAHGDRFHVSLTYK